ncbi:MAG: NAD(P)H-hydrate dehydratase [Clostridiales bacterium]|nr:NAD(P)H-hydrate dehydratase [Clostridiales bacterium]
MIPIYTSADIKAMDAAEIAQYNNELQLIKTAGDKVADAICREHKTGRVLVFCGSGNNGGDGVAAACSLYKRGFEVTAYAVIMGKSPALRALYEEYKTLTGQGVLPFPEDVSAIPHADILVDALLGTGARFGLAGEYLRCARYIAGVSSARVFAVDVPTGVDADTGRCDPFAVRAHHTVCLSGVKPGVVLYPGAEYAGTVEYHRVLQNPYLAPRKRYLFTEDDVASLKRSRNTHKGTYGRLGIIGGSMEMPGSALLTAEAAVRSGAGIVTLGTDADTAKVYAMRVRETLVASVMDAPSFQTFIDGKTALAMGPGLGRGERVKELLKLALSCGLPTVVDADGLNGLSELGPDVCKQASAPVVLTPHPKELSRLLGIPLCDVLTDPIAMAETAAKRYDCTVLLKGAVTVVAAEDATWLCNRGCAGMAKGGSGDVLTGVLGAFLAQGFQAGYAAAAAAHLCGIAGEYAMAKYGSTAMTPYNTVEMLYRAYLPHEA